MPAQTAIRPSSRLEAAQDVRRKRVLVVTGRDEVTSGILCEFLEAVGLQPISLDSAIQSSLARYEGLNELAVRRILGSAQAAVVLLSPDEETRLGPHLSFCAADLEHRQIRGQARASVYFGAGLAIGRMGSSAIVLDLGVARQPSHPDLGDPIDATAGSQWREQLAVRLGAAGCQLEVRGELQQLKIRDFADARPPAPPARRLTFDQLGIGVESLALQAQDWRRPDCIIGLDGCVVATMLATHFQLPLGTLRRVRSRGKRSEKFEWVGAEPRALEKKNATLVVADSLRSTEELSSAREFIVPRVRPQVRTAALCSSCTSTGEERVPDFLGLPEFTERRVLLPWERPA